MRLYVLAAVTVILATDVLDRWSVPIAETEFAVYRARFIADVDRVAHQLKPKQRPVGALPISDWVRH